MKIIEVATITFFAPQEEVHVLFTLLYLSLSANFKLQHETYLVGGDWQFHYCTPLQKVIV